MELPYVGTVPDSCGRCDSKLFRKWGIDRLGKYARQRYCCENGHITLAPREWAFGKQFQSDPDRLLQAARLMGNGKFSLSKIGNFVGLDRYTIYKLYSFLGRGFTCACGRPLHHQGHCLHRWNRSIKSRRQLDWARQLRSISKPNAAAWEYAEKKLQEVLNIAEGMEDDGR